MKDEYDLTGAVRGPVFPIPPGHARMTMRMDDEVLDWFRARVHAMGGGSYQALMNAALREHIARGGEPLEDTLRRVLREELGNVAADKPARRPRMRAKVVPKFAANRAPSPQQRRVG
jgi:hypothetical protein